MVVSAWDSFHFTGRGRAKYFIFAGNCADRMQQAGIDLDKSPDEQWQVKDDGSLHIWMDFPAPCDGREECVIPSGEWSPK
jgi:hypothetical protein